MGKAIDYTGARFGMLTALERTTPYTSPSGQKQTQWLCRCDCGKIVPVMLSNLKYGRTTSCGCSRMADLMGRRFGRLLVVDVASSVSRPGAPNRSRWLCRCDCGNEKIIQARFLIDGTTKSCGCYSRERNIQAHTTHGSSHSRLYRIWQGMRRRCYDPNNNRFERYGGRGITVCKEWNESFASFQSWALSNGYKDSLSIDRVNNDGSYEPANCRWATPKEQANNRGGTVCAG